MKVMVVYGNPKREGSAHRALDRVAERLESKGAEVERLRLLDAALGDCVGCFQCLRTGRPTGFTTQLPLAALCRCPCGCAA